MLEGVGVSGPATRVYQELVATDQAAVAEIARRCGMPERAAARELAALTTLGLAFRVSGRPVRYRAIAPDVGISALIGQREHELQQARGVMHELTEVFQHTARSRHPEAHVEIVRGPDNIARVADRVFEQTRVQLRGFDRAPYTRRPGTHNAMERRQLADGVAFRVIYDRAALAIPGRMAEDIMVSIDDGEQARTLPELPIKLIISDDRLALIPAAVTSRSIDTTFVIHRSPILTALVALFEAEWGRATPIQAPGQPPGATGLPDENTRELLGMLAAGMTDEVIARSLSWSVRTTQRRMRELMAGLGASTRFQAGLAARDRGWL